MEIIKKRVLKKDDYSIDAILYFPLLLTQEHNGNGVLTDYGNNELQRYTPSDSRVLITGYCESKIDEIELFGIPGAVAIAGAYNKVGTFTTPYGESYDGYSGFLSVTDDEIVYTLNAKLVDGVPDERYGVIYTDRKINRTYYNDMTASNQTTTETTFRMYSYGVNKTIFSINDIQFKDDRNANLVETLKVDSSNISVERGEKSPLELHMILATTKNAVGL